MGIWLQVVGVLLQGGAPAVGVKVWWNGTAIGTVSDTAGRFVIAAPERYPAWLRAEGTSDSLRVDSLPAQALRWDIAPTVELHTQTITAQHEGIQRLEPQATVLWGRQTITAAPCCNLSEAFEGTALVDATISDGALGVRQLRLLGFEPVHSPVLYENKPLAIGLYRPWAVQFLPALWVQSIAIAKGIGSVVSGHEGAAGQIQVQYLSPDLPEILHSVEAFARSTGEFFLASRSEGAVDERRRFLLLSNLGWTPFQSYALQDHNGDGFLDIPLFRHGHALARHLRRDTSGDMVEVDVEGLYDYRWGGEVRYREPSDIAALRAWGSYQHLGLVQSSLRRGWTFTGGRALSLLMQGRYFSQALQAGFNRYAAKQPLGWAQLIYRQPLGDTRWMLQIGPTLRVAHYAESLSTWHGYDTSWRRIEIIGGAFGEMTLMPTPTFSAVIGGRIDWHSYWGWQAVPRLHLHWQYAERGAIRISGGRSWRVPDPLPETLPFLMSMRLWRLHFGQWPPVEYAWSYGFFWHHSYMVKEGILRLSIDGVRAHIQHPLLWDIERPWLVSVFSGEKSALYQSLYGEVQYELPDMLRITLGYKLQDIWWQLPEGRFFRPLLPQHRGVLWLTWLTLSRRWQADAIISAYSRQRIPSTAAKSEPYRLPSYSPAYATLTLQITHRIDQWEIQLAGENINDFRQAQPVLAADRPFSPDFDASLIWGPIMGRMASLTVRYSLFCAGAAAPKAPPHPLRQPYARQYFIPRVCGAYKESKCRA